MTAVLMELADLTSSLRDARDEDWPQRALCAQVDPGFFFPDKGGSTADAKRICANCEVRADCLDYALGHGERFGIWGGLSERERRRLLRNAGIAVADDDASDDNDDGEDAAA